MSNALHRIHGGADLCLFGLGFDELGGEALAGLQTCRNSSAAAFAASTAHIVFQTAKLRRGVQMFRATRSSAVNRQIITILQ